MNHYDHVLEACQKRYQNATMQLIEKLIGNRMEMNPNISRPPTNVQWSPNTVIETFQTKRLNIVKHCGLRIILPLGQAVIRPTMPSAGLHDDVIKWKHFSRYWPLCGEFTGHRWILRTKPVTRGFDVFFGLRLDQRLSKQSWGWWFEMPSR